MKRVSLYVKCVGRSVNKSLFAKTSSPIKPPGKREKILINRPPLKCLYPKHFILLFKLILNRATRQSPTYTHFPQNAPTSHPTQCYRTLMNITFVYAYHIHFIKETQNSCNNKSTRTPFFPYHPDKKYYFALQETHLGMEHLFYLKRNNSFIHEVAAS